jgi:hypothetical protein
MSNVIHETTDKPFTIAEMYHLFSNHDTIIFRLEGMGQTVADTILFKQAFECIEELERLAKLGKAVEKAFEEGYDIVFRDYDYVEDKMEVLDFIGNKTDLLEWAEGRE